MFLRIATLITTVLFSTFAFAAEDLTYCENQAVAKAFVAASQNRLTLTKEMLVSQKLLSIRADRVERTDEGIIVSINVKTQLDDGSENEASHSYKVDLQETRTQCLVGDASLQAG